MYRNFFIATRTSSTNLLPSLIGEIEDTKLINDGHNQSLHDNKTIAQAWSIPLQGSDVGTQYRSGIYYYSPEQEKAARETLERHQISLGRKVVTEILPAKKFYKAEEYHQQYLEKGGRFGSKQSASKGCTDPIRCYG